MQAVSKADKARIIDILCAAFDTNRSVNAIAGPGKGREHRIRALMDYSFEVCRRFGKIYLSADRDACALLLYPDRKRFTSGSLLLDFQLILRCIGLRRLFKTLQRETSIKTQHPATPFAYLWFIGVDPTRQGTGRGSALLRDIIAEHSALQRPVYLETSTTANHRFYEAAGFEKYHELEQDFLLTFYRHLHN